MQAALGAGLFDTTVRFDGDRDVDVEMSTVSVSAGWLVDDRWTVRASAGAVLGGELKPDDGTVHDVDSGALAGIGAEYRALTAGPGDPFVDVSLSLGFSWARTSLNEATGRQDYSAADARLGVRYGFNVRNRFFPFLSARVFGGPVKWDPAGDDATGSDIHHYQMGAGAAARFGAFAIFAEFAGLGEKAFSAGLSTAW